MNPLEIIELIRLLPQLQYSFVTVAYSISNMYAPISPYVLPLGQKARDYLYIPLIRLIKFTIKLAISPLVLLINIIRQSKQPNQTRNKQRVKQTRNKRRVKQTRKLNPFKQTKEFLLSPYLFPPAEKEEPASNLSEEERQKIAAMFVGYLFIFSVIITSSILLVTSPPIFLLVITSCTILTGLAFQSKVNTEEKSYKKILAKRSKELDTLLNDVAQPLKGKLRKKIAKDLILGANRDSVLDRNNEQEAALLNNKGFMQSLTDLYKSKKSDAQAHYLKATSYKYRRNGAFAKLLILIAAAAIIFTAPVTLPTTILISMALLTLASVVQNFLRFQAINASTDMMIGRVSTFKEKIGDFISTAMMSTENLSKVLDEEIRSVRESKKTFKIEKMDTNSPAFFSATCLLSVTTLIVGIAVVAATAGTGGLGVLLAGMFATATSAVIMNSIQTDHKNKLAELENQHKDLKNQPQSQVIKIKIEMLRITIQDLKRRDPLEAQKSLFISTLKSIPFILIGIVKTIVYIPTIINSIDMSPADSHKPGYLSRRPGSQPQYLLDGLSPDQTYQSIKNAYLKNCFSLHDRVNQIKLNSLEFQLKKLEKSSGNKELNDFTVTDTSAPIPTPESKQFKQNINELIRLQNRSFFEEAAGLVIPLLLSPIYYAAVLITFVKILTIDMLGDALHKNMHPTIIKATRMLLSPFNLLYIAIEQIEKINYYSTTPIKKIEKITQLENAILDYHEANKDDRVYSSRSDSRNWLKKITTCDEKTRNEKIDIYIKNHTPQPKLDEKEIPKRPIKSEIPKRPVRFTGLSEVVDSQIKNTPEQGAKISNPQDAAYDQNIQDTSNSHEKTDPPSVLNPMHTTDKPRIGKETLSGKVSSNFESTASQDDKKDKETNPTANPQGPQIPSA